MIKQLLKLNWLSQNEVFVSVLHIIMETITMQFTLKLIDAVVLECECLTLAQHIFSAFPTWEKKHAEVIMQVKNDLCKEY